MRAGDSPVCHVAVMHGYEKCIVVPVVLLNKVCFLRQRTFNVVRRLFLYSMLSRDINNSHIWVYYSFQPIKVFLESITLFPIKPRINCEFKLTVMGLVCGIDPCFKWLESAMKLLNTYGQAPA